MWKFVYDLPVLSIILQTALLIVPGITWPFMINKAKLRSNVSNLSAILSLVTGTLIVVLVDPAVKVALIGVEP